MSTDFHFRKVYKLSKNAHEMPKCQKWNFIHKKGRFIHKKGPLTLNEAHLISKLLLFYVIFYIL